MREIKFRAWDTLNKAWWNNLATTDSLNLTYAIKPYHIELTQFTGLLDKNSKGIYEGDIIKLTWESNDEVEIGSVYFERGQFTVNESTQGLGVLFGIADGNVEVIGNIYENPNLIGVKNG